MQNQIVITGASGQLGGYLINALMKNQSDPLTAWYHRGQVHSTDVKQMAIDLTDPNAVNRQLDLDKPSLIIHCAGLTQISACFENPTLADLLNAQSAKIFADYAIQHNARLIYLSTDMVFDGGTLDPYRETDSPNPQTIYGQSKYAGEGHAFSTPNSCVVRLPLLYGASLNKKKSFQDQLLSDLKNGKTRSLFTDEYRTPLKFSIAAQQILAIAKSHAQGLYHLSGGKVLSRYEHARQIASTHGLDTNNIKKALSANFISPEVRPLNTSLSAKKFLSRFPEFKT